MTTMFGCSRKEARRRFEDMPVREFLERLLRDDVVDQIVCSGTILVIEWTSAVKKPCRMIGFGIRRDMQTLKNIYFAGVNDQAGVVLSLRDVFCERSKIGISVDELMEWIKPLNIQAVEWWAEHILEAKEELFANSRSPYLPLRYIFLCSVINL